MPSGEYAILFPGSHIQTHLGRVELPPFDEPLYHRITNVGGFKIAGQAHQSTRTLEFVDWQWHDRQPACGVSPVIYDHLGKLHISQCGPVGSQGYRYVDMLGRIWTGDETYGSPFGLSEWSYYGALYIGQGHEGGGCLVWDGAVLRVLEEGSCRFVRVRGDGVRVAISYAKPDGAVIVHATLDELRALPVRSAPTPQPPTPIPVPPKPKPEPKMPTAPNALPIIRGVLADPRFFHINPAEEIERGQITDEVVRRLGGVPWGRKDRDKNPDNQNNSDDALCYRLEDGRFEIYDILIGNPQGSPRESFAAFSYAGTFADGENGYFREVPATGTPAPTPTPKPPTPSPQPDALAAILKRLDALEGPRQVAIKSSRDRYMRDDWSGDVAKFDRTAVGSGEQFTIEPVK